MNLNTNFAFYNAPTNDPVISHFPTPAYVHAISLLHMLRRRTLEIPNSKTQIPNKFQFIIPNF
jgi:hypothetical protein